MSSRDNILNKLRLVSHQFEQIDVATSMRDVVMLDDGSREALVELFIKQGELLNNQITRMSDDESAIEAILNIVGDDTGLLAWDFEHIPVRGLENALKQNNINRQPHNDASVRVGITGASGALAGTGSIVIASGDGKARSVSLLPYVHVAIVKTSQILPNMEAWMKEQRAKGLDAFRQSSNVTVITGASRTADIGMELVLGAHGPAELHIILMDD